MLLSCTHMAIVGVKGLIEQLSDCNCTYKIHIKYTTVNKVNTVNNYRKTAFDQ